MFHEIVRGSGGRNATRPLVLPTLHTGSDPALLDALAAEIAALDDPNLIATVHNYGFWPFSVNVAGYTRFNAEVQQNLTDQFDLVHAAFTARGVPVIIGEYGLLGFDRHTGTIEQGEKLKFFEYFGYAARQRGFTTMLWDNGQHFDRTAYEWRDQALFDQISSSWTERSGTASSDLVFVPASGGIAAQNLTLNPNGTSFEALLHDGAELTAGTDYTPGGQRAHAVGRAAGAARGRPDAGAGRRARGPVLGRCAVDAADHQPGVAGAPGRLGYDGVVRDPDVVHG